MTDTQTTEPASTETDVRTAVDAYFGMWNEPDPDRRAEHIRQAWSVDASYLDPKLEATGHDGLSEMVASVHALFPGHRFRRTSGIDIHHAEVRFGWELFAPDGSITVAGLDVARLAPDGKLASLVGFFGDLPEE